MKKVPPVIVVVCFYSCFLFGQHPATLDMLQQKFRTFDYDGVIELADSALALPTLFTQEQLISIYEMKAVSHFSKSELPDARLCFIEILKLDSLHTLDPVKTSPKIITFYNSVQVDFVQMTKKTIEPLPQQSAARDTITIVRETLGAYKKSIPASLILPGTGHLFMGEKKRGIILTSLSLVTLSSAIYFTDKTQKKENEYMSAIDEPNIAVAYDAYNTAYKTRNALWATFAAIWIYAQVDLLYFQQGRQSIHFSAIPALHNSIPLFVNFCVRF